MKSCPCVYLSPPKLLNQLADFCETQYEYHATRAKVGKPFH